MNDLPFTWSDELAAVYPKRSGPLGLKNLMLMLALRRALFDSTWNDIIEGVKRYASYCDQAGITGSNFVKSPRTFIEDGSWAEVYEFQAPETKEQKERREIAERDRHRMERAKEAGRACNPPIEPMRGESVGAYETRVRQAETMRTPMGYDVRGAMGDLGVPKMRISALSNRLRVK